MKRLTLVVAMLLAALAAAAAPYQYSTPVPPGIAAPKEMPTRLGTLKFFDGVPDPASTHKIYDNLDFQRAMQGYLLALPAMNQLTNRTNILKMGPANTTVPIWEDLVDSRTTELTANNNTPYTWFWLDLHQGPLVLEVPPKVLGPIDDMWYRWNTDLGITGPDKGAGGKYLLLPPGYKDAVPDGYHLVRSPTFQTWAGWRSLLVNGDPKPGVDAVKQHMTIYPLAQAGNPPPALTFVNMSGKPFNMVAPADASFWPMLHQVVQEAPTETIDATTLGIWASIGIEKGKPFAPDARMKKILAEAAAVGDATGRALGYRNRDKDAYFFEDRQWMRAFVGGWSLYVKDGVPAYDYYFLGLQRTSIVSSKKLAAGKSELRFEFAYDGGGPGKGGKGTRLVNGEKVAEGRIEHTEGGIFSADETADVSIDLGPPVVEAIGAEARSRFTGRIPKVTVQVQ